MATIIRDTDFTFPGQVNLEHGIIKDKYYFTNNRILELVTDRLILDGNLMYNGIPYLGQLIVSLGNQLTDHANGYFKMNLIRNPEINFCFRLPIEENVKFYIGDYLNGLIWNEYKDGRRLFGNTELDDGLSLNAKLNKQLILLFTKDNYGNYRFREIKDNEQNETFEFPESLYLIQKKIKEVFNIGKKHANSSGYELAGTTYCFVKDKNNLLLNDFIHTPYNSIYLKISKDSNYIENLNLFEYFEEYIQTNRDRKNHIKEPGPKELELYSKKCFDLYNALMGKDFEPVESKNLISDLLKKIHAILREKIVR
ncbi:MAG: hypothetical protein PF485_05045 [Bacteroidales bacterium]|jgi:hypothetical protein|nr:hypothetical protein [Bacteroidales bacterium]